MRSNLESPANEPGDLEQRVSDQAFTIGLKPALLACLTGQESRRWTVAELMERLNNLSIPCSKPAVIGALGELSLDISLCSWVPWNLLEQRSEWILKPKNDLFELLSGIRSLPSGTHHLTDEHKSILLVVIGYRRKGGVSQTRIEAILGLNAEPYLHDLATKNLIYTAPDKQHNWWRPTPEALLALGFRSYTEIAELKELEHWFESQKTFSSEAEKRANLSPLLERAETRGKRKRQRNLVRRSSAPRAQTE